MHVVHVKGLDGLRSLRDEWDVLASLSGNYFHCFNWFLKYVQFGCKEPQKLVFLVVKHEARTLGILPLELRTERIRRVPFRIWSMVGAQQTDVMMLASSSDFLARSSVEAPGILAAATKFLAEQDMSPGILQLGRYVPGSNTDVACRQWAGRSHSYIRGQTQRFLTDRPYHKLQTSLSGKFRANLRNASNRASKEGDLALKVSALGGDGFENAFREFIRVEASGWKAQRPTGVALAANPVTEQRDFLGALFADAEGYCPMVFELLSGSKTIAALLAVRYKQTIAVPKIGFDEAYRRCSPGHLLVRSLLEYACADADVRQLDFVADAVWYLPWQPVAHPYLWSYLAIKPLKSVLPMALLNLPHRRPRAACGDE